MFKEIRSLAYSVGIHLEELRVRWSKTSLKGILFSALSVSFMLLNG